jgi:hypothetical protein
VAAAELVQQVERQLAALERHQEYLEHLLFMRAAVVVDLITLAAAAAG